MLVPFGIIESFRLENKIVESNLTLPSHFIKSQLTSLCSYFPVIISFECAIEH